MELLSKFFGPFFLVSIQCSFGNLKKRILNVSSSFYFLQLKYPYWILFFKISTFVFLVFCRIIHPIGLLFSHLACPSGFFSYNASALDSKATRFMSCYQYHACIHFIFLETVHIFSALQLSYCDDRDSWHVISACIMWSFCTDPIWKWQCVLFYYVVFGWFLFCMQALLSPTRLSSLPTIESLFASKLYKPLSMSACSWCR